MKKIDLVKPLTGSALLLAAGASQAAIDVTAATGALVTDGNPPFY